MKPLSQGHSLNTEGPTPLSDLFSAEEIAVFLGVDVGQFLHLAGHGDLTPVEVQGAYFYKAEDVRRFLTNAGIIEGENLW